MASRRSFGMNDFRISQRCHFVALFFSAAVGGRYRFRQLFEASLDIRVRLRPSERGVLWQVMRRGVLGHQGFSQVSSSELPRDLFAFFAQRARPNRLNASRVNPFVELLTFDQGFRRKIGSSVTLMCVTIFPCRMWCSIKVTSSLAGMFSRQSTL